MVGGAVLNEGVLYWETENEESCLWIFRTLFWSDSASALKYIKTETSRREMISTRLTVDDLEKAGLEIIKFCQRKMFPDELFQLQQGKSVKGCSHIYELCPLIEDVCYELVAASTGQPCLRRLSI